MSTPEEKLAALLREQAETVVPAGDGLAKIQQRVAARRKARWLVVPGAALVTAAGVTAFFVFGSSGSSSLQQLPGSPPPSVASPTPTGGGLDHAFENPALWPFTSAAEIAAWPTTYPYAEDKVALVQHYLADVLHVSGTTLSKPCESCDVVDISYAGHKVGQAALERFLLDGHQVFTIDTIGQTDLTLSTPTDGEAISSPTQVSGRIAGVDENVSIALVTRDGATLATAGAPAGSAVPWQGTLAWSDTSWTHGGIVLKTFSAKDGSLNRLTVVPVSNGGPAASPTPAGQPFTPAIWPFASHDQAQAWRTDPATMSWADSNLGVAQHFVSDYLKLTGVHLVQTCNSCDVVEIVAADGTQVGTVGLVREDDGSPRAYSVAGVTFGDSFAVSTPAEGAKVTTPLRVGGTITGVDENVVISLVTQDGRTIGTAATPAGSGAPWSTTISWTDDNWYTGALVLKTYSPKDGSLNRLIVRRVVRGT